MYSSPLIHQFNTEVGPEDFRVIRLLGKGDVGRVYLVNRKGTKKLYAMKVLLKEEMIKRKKVRGAQRSAYVHVVADWLSCTQVKRALTERQILSSANHPFIVTLYHCFQVCVIQNLFILCLCVLASLFAQARDLAEQKLPVLHHGVLWWRRVLPNTAAPAWQMHQRYVFVDWWT